VTKLAKKQTQVDVWASRLERELRAAGTAERARHEKNYLKSHREHFGTSVPKIRASVKTLLREQKQLGRVEMVALVGQLWSRDVHELRVAAAEVLRARSKLLTADDVALLERMLRESGTWALVDSIAPDVVGPLVESLGRYEILDRWIGDPDFWIRRAAMLALLRPLREGKGELARFLRYAELTLDEKEFFIRKAIGWILREISKKRPTEVADWLDAHVARLNGVTVREAVRYLPASRSARILKAWKASK
jgi:3-methyladenine DNA glycosylase AlkD